MKLKLEERDGWHIISIQGALMMTGLRHVPPIFEVLGDKDDVKVALDLEHTDAMDSGALSILVQLRKQVQAKNGTLVVVAPSEDVRVLFGIVGFEDQVPIYDSMAEFESRVLYNSP
jgi:anti-anti-sigma factor